MLANMELMLKFLNQSKESLIFAQVDTVKTLQLTVAALGPIEVIEITQQRELNILCDTVEKF